MTLGGYGAFFDESERLVAGDPLCVAGYTFKDAAYKQFCRAWGRYLKTALPSHGIAAMHMTDLVQGKRAFKGITIADRVSCLNRGVDIICAHALIVTGALVDQKEFETEAGPDWPERFGSSYTALCQRAAQTTASWLREKKRFQPVVYTFEAGHKWQYQTDNIFTGIGRTPFLKKLYQYGHHTFAPKEACYGAQAADVSAWISVRIRVGDQHAKSLKPFMPPMARLVHHFNVNDDAMVRFLRGKTLKDFIGEQRERPVAEDIPSDVGPAKRRFR